VTFAVAAAVLALPVAVSAQTGARAAPSPPVFDGDRVLTRVHQEDLVALVRNNGDTLLGERGQGAVSVWAKTADGLNYVVIGTVCDQPDYGPGCLGVDFQVRYDADSRATTDNINRANITYNFAKVSRGFNEEDADTVFVTHYTILDGGQKMENLATILLNLIDVAPKASEIVFP
jgi:hypothetical protein